MELQLYAISTSTLDAGEQSASRPASSSAGQSPVTFEIGGCVGLRVCRDIVERTKAYFCRESKFDPSTSPRA